MSEDVIRIDATVECPRCCDILALQEGQDEMTCPCGEIVFRPRRLLDILDDPEALWEFFADREPDDLMEAGERVRKAAERKRMGVN